MDQSQNDLTKLLSGELWHSPCPVELIDATGCRPDASVAEMLAHVLERLAERPEDASKETLREIFLEVEPFLEPARKDWLRSIGLLRRAPRGGEFRPMTDSQLAADERASGELAAKFEQMDRADAPARDHAARLIAELAIRARATESERAELERRGLLPPDFEAPGRIQ